MMLNLQKYPPIASRQLIYGYALLYRYLYDIVISSKYCLYLALGNDTIPQEI